MKSDFTRQLSIVFVCVGTVLLFSCATALADAAGAQNSVDVTELLIGSVETAGNRGISDAKIIAKLRSRVGDLFDPAVAEDDARRIAELDGVDYCYYNVVAEKGRAKITFAVIEQNVIRSIDFLGNEKVKDKTLLNKLDLKIGQWLDTFVISASADKIAEFYHKKGYAFATVTIDEDSLSTGNIKYNISEGSIVKINKVSFTGNQDFSAGQLKKAVKTKTREWFLFQGKFKTEVLEEDVVRLQKAYLKKGYLDAQIRAEQTFNSGKDKIDVNFVIKEGPIYITEEIRLTGVQFSENKDLLSELKGREGQPYSQFQADMGAKKILSRYNEIGFIETRVEQKRYFVARGKVRLQYDIQEGERFRIGSIGITGNLDTQDKVVRRVLDEYDFVPGNWYNSDIARGDGGGELEKALRSIVMTQAATIVPTAKSPGQAEAQVNIIEGQTGSIMLGAGVASDVGVIGQLVYEQRNFDIFDTPTDLGEFITGKAFKGGGQKLRIAFEPGTEISRYSANFTEPYLNDQPISLDVSGSSFERWRESYNEKRKKGYIAFEERMKNKWRQGIAFRVENVKVSDLETDAPQEIVDVKGDNMLMGVKLFAGKDGTNSRFMPSEGYDFNFGYEQVGGDHNFGIASGIVHWYQTLAEDLAERKTVLGTKIYAATIIGDAPPFEKFYAGGIGSIRGFDYRGVSTRGLQIGVTPPERKDPIGSDWVALANAEITVPVVEETLSGLFFVDGGLIDTGGVRISVGIGIQILIPQWFGPVPMRFQIATPLSKESEDETQAFSFSVGRLF